MIALVGGMESENEYAGSGRKKAERRVRARSLSSRLYSIFKSVASEDAEELRRERNVDRLFFISPIED